MFDLKKSKSHENFKNDPFRHDAHGSVAGSQRTTQGRHLVVIDPQHDDANATFVIRPQRVVHTVNVIGAQFGTRRQRHDAFVGSTSVQQHSQQFVKRTQFGSSGSHQ